MILLECLELSKIIQLLLKLTILKNVYINLFYIYFLGEEDARHDMPRRPIRTFRGRGLSRRGERQRGRGRGRGALRGSKRKRDDAEMCVFYMQGKCHRVGGF